MCSNTSGLVLCGQPCPSSASPPVTAHPQCSPRPWALQSLKLSCQDVTFHVTLQHYTFLLLPDTDMDTDLLHTINKITFFLIVCHRGHYKTSIRLGLVTTPRPVTQNTLPRIYCFIFFIFVIMHNKSFTQRNEKDP